MFQFNYFFVKTPRGIKFVMFLPHTFLISYAKVTADLFHFLPSVNYIFHSLKMEPKFSFFIFNHFCLRLDFVKKISTGSTWRFLALKMCFFIGVNFEANGLLLLNERLFMFFVSS